jgi:hypothetical protein
MYQPRELALRAESLARADLLELIQERLLLHQTNLSRAQAALEAHSSTGGGGYSVTTFVVVALAGVVGLYLWGKLPNPITYFVSADKTITKLTENVETLTKNCEANNNTVASINAVVNEVFKQQRHHA